MTMPALPNSELAVMELLWQRGRLPARLIQEALYPDDSRPQHGTVQRLLKRLEDKGYVVRDRDLGVNLFSPTLSKETYAGNQLEALANRLTEGSLVPIITRLVEDDRLSSAEIERLRAFLDE